MLLPQPPLDQGVFHQIPLRLRSTDQRAAAINIGTGIVRLKLARANLARYGRCRSELAVAVLAIAFTCAAKAASLVAFADCCGRP